MAGETPPTLPPAPREPAQASFVARWWPKRRTWIVLGRALGGIGAFIAALIAAANFAFGDDEPTTKDDDPTTLSQSGSEPYSYAEARDATGVIRVELPVAWGNRDGSAWVPGSTIGRLEGLSTVGQKLVASTNVSDWQAPGDLSTPGAFVGVSRTILQRWTAADLARAFNYTGCAFDKEEQLTTSDFLGWVVHTTCTDSATRWITVAATPVGARDLLVLIQAKLVSRRDEEAYTRLLGTLVVTPS